MRAAYDELLRKAKKADRHARIDGVMVCEMVTGGVDTLIGVSTDELFGPVVTFGLGGIFVEVFGDVTFRVPPFAEAEARRALDELKGIGLLRGVRGRKPVDIDALVDDDHEGATARDGSRRRRARARHQPVGRETARRGRARRIGGEEVSEADGRRRAAAARLENGVLWLTINRADKGNAIPYYVRDELIEAFRDANWDLGVRAVVLTAAGERHFCTGADLSVPQPAARHASPTARPTASVGTARST